MTDPAVKAAYQKHAKEIWDGMNANAKHGVRFGLFPADIITEAKRLGYDDERLLCVSLMECAK